MIPDPLSLPAIHASHVGIWIADTKARVQRVGRGEAIAAVAATPHLLLNAPLTGDRLGYPELSGLDLLELFAFLYPARFAVPTPAGLAAAALLHDAHDMVGLEREVCPEPFLEQRRHFHRQA